MTNMNLQQFSDWVSCNMPKQYVLSSENNSWINSSIGISCILRFDCCIVSSTLNRVSFVHNKSSFCCERVKEVCMDDLGVAGKLCDICCICDGSTTHFKIIVE